MDRDREHQVRWSSLLLALVAAAVLGTGLLVAARGPVDQAAVTAAPDSTPATGQEGRAGAAPRGDDPVADAPPAAVGADTATTSPEAGGGDAPVVAPPSIGAGAPGAEGSAGSTDAGSTGAAQAGGPAPAPAPPAPPTPVATAPAAPAPAGAAPPAPEAPVTSGQGSLTGEPRALPYGAAGGAEQVQPQGELAQTGPPVPASVAVLLGVAALGAARLARPTRARR